MTLILTSVLYFIKFLIGVVCYRSKLKDNTMVHTTTVFRLRLVLDLVLLLVIPIGLMILACSEEQDGKNKDNKNCTANATIEKRIENNTWK